jgi:hypothetical protein
MKRNIILESYSHILSDEELQEQFDNMLDEDGSFYSTIDNVKENTGLSRDIQLRAIKNLCERNLISTKLKGVPARRYIQFN